MEAHHSVNGPDTGRNSGGRRIKKNCKYLSWTNMFSIDVLFKQLTGISLIISRNQSVNKQERTFETIYGGEAVRVVLFKKVIESE